MQKGEMLMKRGRTAYSKLRHWFRAIKALRISPKEYRAMAKLPGIYIDQLVAVDSIAFGRGRNPKVSVLLVPELRKRRSERDPVVLAEQIKNAGNRLVEIQDSFNSGQRVAAK